MFFHRHVDYRGNTGCKKFENISQVSVDLYVSLYNTSAASDGADVHE